jgi:hypothetical protein
VSDPRANWAILRQFVVATRDALGDGARVSKELRLPGGFADPSLVDIGLHDYVTPVGPQKFFELVGPLACRERARAAGVRLVADQTYQDYPLIQMHPSDVGILLELDGIPDPAAWYWDDVTPGPREDALIDDIVEVRIAVPDPAATTAQWAHIIGLEPTSSTSLDFSGCRVEFVPGAVSQLVGVDFQLAGAAEAPPGDLLLGLAVGYRTRAAADV